jgi:predicted PurR-regulated permease PerM
MPENPESKTSFDFRRPIGLAYFIGILFALFWAKEFLLPIVLAALIGFLLMPLVSRLERWGRHPVLAALSVVACAVALIGGLCVILSVETLDLVNSIPKYRDNITSKWASLQKAPPGPLKQSRYHDLRSGHG